MMVYEQETAWKASII